jgi:diguanylate cyclase (GGDEF)-like protein
MYDSQTPDDSEVTMVTTLPPERQERSVTQMQGTLTVLVGAHVGARFVLSSQATLIGRNPRAHVAIDDAGISRNQARILDRAGSYAVEDMDSTNGTCVDGVRVLGCVPLRDGARIQMGNTLLRFALQDQLECEAAQRVYEASVRDGLTGAFNRRHFEERLIAEFAFATRHGTALCVLMADIDHFKRINDRWGHQAGDLVLRRVGAELREAARAEDLVARYGGEEFVLLARGIDPAGAKAFAERLRVLLERAPITWQGERIAVTTSIGLAHNHTGAASSDPQRLVAAADKALYAAKAAGRNRVELARSPGSYAVAHPERSASHATPVPRASSWGNDTAPVGDRKNQPARIKPRV